MRKHQNYNSRISALDKPEIRRQAYYQILGQVSDKVLNQVYNKIMDQTDETS